MWGYFEEWKQFFFHLDINECLTNNGGCHDQAICANTIGSFNCECKSGYQGNGLNCTGNSDHYFFSKKYYIEGKSINLIDINECFTNNGGCSVNAKCANTIGSFNCECTSGYSGDGFICTGIYFYFSFFFWTDSAIMKTKNIYFFSFRY